MRIYNVNRGVGKTPELFGLSEKYMGQMVVGLLLGFVGFGICRVVFGGNMIGIIVLVVVVGGTFFYCQNMSIKYGDHGITKRDAHKKRPHILTSRSRSVFLNLKK